MTSLNARSFQVPGGDLEPLNEPVVILWDIENCQVPSNVRPEDVGGNIRMALRSHPVIKGTITMFSAYGDFSIIPRRLREGCQRTGVKLVDVPNGRKNAADMAIVVDMFLFALDSPPPCTIMLISGDVDFAQALHVLGQRGYTIVLVFPAGRTVSPALYNAARFILDWTSLVHGRGFISSVTSTATATDFSRDAVVLQDKKVTVSRNKSEQAGFNTYKHPMNDISDVPSISFKYVRTMSATPSVPTSRCGSSLLSLNGALGKRSKQEDLIVKVQTLEADRPNGLLPRSLSPARDKPDCHTIIEWPSHPVGSAACKFVNFGTYTTVKDVATTVEKKNLSLDAQFDQSDKAHTSMGRSEMKDKDVLSNFASLVDADHCLNDKLAVKCLPRTDLLPSGNPYTSNRISNKAHSCSSGFKRQRPQEIESTHPMKLETRKRHCSDIEVVEKQNQEKKIKKSEELSMTEYGDTASGPVEDKMINTSTKNDVRTSETTSGTCLELQPGEGLKSEVEVNNVQSEKHYVCRNVYDGTDFYNLPNLGNKCLDMDKLQGSNNIATMVGPIVSPDKSLVHRVITAKEMPPMEMKADVSQESKLGGNLENMVQLRFTSAPLAWCEICNIYCSSMLQLDLHKMGSMHKKRILNLHGSNCASTNIVGIDNSIVSPGISLLNNVTTAKEMPPMEMKADVSQESKLGGNLETMVPVRFTSAPLAWCEICNIYCSSMLQLDLHKMGSMHKKRILNLHGSNCATTNIVGIDNSIVSPGISLLNIATTAKEMPPVNIKADLSPESTTVSAAWCEICGVHYSIKRHLEHEQGKKHRIKLLELHEAKHGPDGSGFVKLNSEEVLNLSNEKENFGKTLENCSPALGASPAIYDSTICGKEASIEVVSNNNFSVTKVRQEKVTDHWCIVCNVNCYSLCEHSRGKKHKRRLRELQNVNHDHSMAGSSPAEPMNETSANEPKGNKQE